MAYAFMQFLGSVQGQKILREILPYALSPETSVAQELSEKKVNANYNIIYKNFLDPDATLTSFSLENPGMFHRGLKPLFDEEAGVANNIAKLSHWMVCSNTKAQTLMNLSSSCITQ